MASDVAPRSRLGAEDERRETDKVSFRNLPSFRLLSQYRKPRFAGLFLVAGNLAGQRIPCKMQRFAARRSLVWIAIS